MIVQEEVDQFQEIDGLQLHNDIIEDEERDVDQQIYDQSMDDATHDDVAIMSATINDEIRSQSGKVVGNDEITQDINGEP